MPEPTGTTDDWGRADVSAARRWFRRALRPVEDRYGVTGGHIHHGENALDQVLIRPTPECLHHATPVAGLYLCAAGTHPGGGLTCAPGLLAAQTVK